MYGVFPGQGLPPDCRGKGFTRTGPPANKRYSLRLYPKLAIPSFDGGRCTGRTGAPPTPPRAPGMIRHKNLAVGHVSIVRGQNGAVEGDFFFWGGGLSHFGAVCALIPPAPLANRADGGTTDLHREKKGGKKRGQSTPRRGAEKGREETEKKRKKKKKEKKRRKKRRAHLSRGRGLERTHQIWRRGGGLRGWLGVVCEFVGGPIHRGAVGVGLLGPLGVRRAGRDQADGGGARMIF